MRYTCGFLPSGEGAQTSHYVEEFEESFYVWSRGLIQTGLLQLVLCQK